jgi:drug/metabolite transporter (DMT)-like permease
MEPVYGIAVAWMVFAETPTLRMLLGGALIIFAIVLSSRLGAEQPPKPRTVAEGA